MMTKKILHREVYIIIDMSYIHKMLYEDFLEKFYNRIYPNQDGEKIKKMVEVVINNDKKKKKFTTRAIVSIDPLEVILTDYNTLHAAQMKKMEYLHNRYIQAPTMLHFDNLNQVRKYCDDLIEKQENENK